MPAEPYPSITVRAVVPADEARWRVLWDAYTRFYEREPVEEITRRTWARILDPAVPIFAIVAERAGDGGRSILGMANYLLHDSTSHLTPVCYLQDLYVDPVARGGGAGRALIDWLWLRTREEGWSTLYWQTRESNHQARALYDSYTPHSGFVRYVLRNQPVL
ncbi:GNAT family N-acetyltransferase [Hamadaea tsunoensis]|uniref:GNAT family N-acetyltransferase n=1 Tax=Hamadaea tsunoensis TaxID=53368 RepID=UPI0003FA16F3|nr:GNAT family N-acetyltransferase [Hamadaea tsunoensis]